MNRDFHIIGAIMREGCWTSGHVSSNSPVQDWRQVLSVEPLPASAAAAFSPSFRAAAVVTKSFSKTTCTASFYGFSRCTKVPASRCVTSYSEINLFRSLSLFFSSACKRINRCDAWFAAAPVRPELFGIGWEISHSLHPADLWPCCTSAAPASAAAQRPPARPGAAVEHPNEREREMDALKKDQRRTWYEKKTLSLHCQHTPTIMLTNISYVNTNIYVKKHNSYIIDKWKVWMVNE